MDLLSLAGLIPGPIGAVAGGVSGLLAGSKARKKEDQIQDIQRRIAEEQAKIYQQYVTPAINDLANTAGYRPGTETVGMGTSGGWAKPVTTTTPGTFDPNFNPNAASAGQFFDPASLAPEMVGYREAGDRNYDSAVNAARADLMGRGFIGRDSLRESTVANIRREQGADNARFDRGLLTDLDNQRRAYLMEGLQKKDAARNQLIGIGTGAGGNAFGQLNSLGNVYASRAGNAATGVGQLAGVASQGTGGVGGSLNDIVNWIKRQTQRGSYAPVWGQAGNDPNT